MQRMDFKNLYSLLNKLGENKTKIYFHSAKVQLNLLLVFAILFCSNNKVMVIIWFVLLFKQPYQEYIHLIKINVYCS